MTDSDWPPFIDVFESLSRAFNKPVTADTPTQARVYFEHLQDYPLPLVEQAKAALIRGSKFFPKVYDWRRACDSLHAGEPTRHPPLSRQLPDGTVEPVYCCPTCQDSGWRPACGCPMDRMDLGGECPEHPRYGPDQRVYRQAMMACACRDANPAFQANRPKVRGAISERNA